MKKFIIIALVALLGSCTAIAQLVVYGTVKYDGFQSITKKAFWLTRPEAKLVFEGGHPSGVLVYKIPVDYFIRFVPGENNKKDHNYIVAPAGTLFYQKDGRWFLSDCGNEIEFMWPVNQVTIVSPPVDDTLQKQQQAAAEEAERQAIAQQQPTNINITININTTNANGTGGGYNYYLQGGNNGGSYYRGSSLNQNQNYHCGGSHGRPQQSYHDGSQSGGRPSGSGSMSGGRPSGSGSMSGGRSGGSISGSGSGGSGGGRRN